jgi:isoleucyl-tRNA synthetase
LADVEIVSKEITGYKVASQGKISVALDIEVDDALKQEGIAREIISKLQGLRKEQQFEVMDRIQIKIEAHDYIKSAINQFKMYICTELLANDMVFESAESLNHTIEVDENTVRISIQKA